MGLAQLALPFVGYRVLITGHTGFKGSWLAFWLAEAGASVSGVSLGPPSSPSLFVDSGIGELIESDHRGDVRDPTVLTSMIAALRPNVIFHMAAASLVRRSFADPVGTWTTNVIGTVHLLDALRATRQRCVVIVVTSDKCYAHPGYRRALDESDPLGGEDPYSASKAAQELVCASYRASYFPADRIDDHGVQLATVRAGNVLGGGDWAEDRLVPDAARAVLAGSPVTARAPTAIRPWQHVLDALAGYMTLAGRMISDSDSSYCGAWNFGPEEGKYTVSDVLTLVDEQWEGRLGWEIGGAPDHDLGAHRHPPCPPRVQNDSPQEAPWLLLSAAKARVGLGWTPTWDFRTTVSRTAWWYRRVKMERPPTDARSAMRQDIEAFESDRARLHESAQ